LTKDVVEISPSCRTVCALFAGAAILGLAPVASASTFGKFILRPGTNDHADVRILQLELRRLGYGIGVDGIFGPATRIAVEAFQRSRHLPATGIVNAATFRALRVAETGRGGFIPEAGTYRVEAGDTLSGIASRFGTTAAALAAANDLSLDATLQVGQVLRVPEGTGATGSGTTYTVEAGDTLYGIASRFGVSVGALAAANGLSLDSTLQIGEVLHIPSAGSTDPTPPPSSPPGSSTSAPPTSLASQLVHDALQFLGVPYVWGGASPAGFDCSGLVQYVARLVGIDLPRTSQEQFTVGTPVAESDLQPGDLVFFDTYGYASHVGIYIGNGEFVDAPETGGTVSINSLNDGYWSSHYIGARDILP
jgi:peptidoglycan endopeptidase LytE